MRRAGLWRGIAGAAIAFLATTSFIASEGPSLRAAYGGGRVTAAGTGFAVQPLAGVPRATGARATGESSTSPANASTSTTTAGLPATDVALPRGESTRATPQPRATNPATKPPATSPTPTSVPSSRDPRVNEDLLVPVGVPRSGTANPLVSNGRFKIPRLGLDRPLYEGIAQNVINAGVAHWPGTANPGGVGNVVIAGHRSTYSRPFHDIANLRPGDVLIFETNSGWRYTYTVERQFVVPSNALWIKNQTAGRHVTIFTCHPIGSARQRLVTVGVLSKSERLA